jgi:uncharacterized protein YoxC
MTVNINDLEMCNSCLSHIDTITKLTLELQQGQENYNKLWDMYSMRKAETELLHSKIEHQTNSWLQEYNQLQSELKAKDKLIQELQDEVKRLQKTIEIYQEHA